MELAPRDLLPRLGDHRVPLDCTGSPLPRKVDCCSGQGVRESTPPELGTNDQAGDRPHATVIFVLVPSRPRDTARHQSRVGSPGLDRTPSDGFILEVGYDSTRHARLRLPAVSLAEQSLPSFLICQRVPLGPADLEPLAVAPRFEAAGAPEDGDHVRPRHFVRGQESELRLRGR
jgi:hypothetical protein